MRVVVLIAVSLAAWGVALPLAGVWLGPGNLTPAVVALAICVVPAAMTLQLVELVAARSADKAAVAILAGIGVRMLTAVAGVVILGDAVTRTGVTIERFTGWVTVMYLVTLAAETVLMAKAVNAAAARRKATPAAPAPPAGAP